jgi:hypothetical protein
MGVTSSKVFVDRMLRLGAVDEANHVLVISSDNGSFNTVNFFEALVCHELEDDDEDDTRTNLLLSLVVHHSNAQRLKKQKKVTEALRRRRQGVVALLHKKTRRAHPKYFYDPTSGVCCRMIPKVSLWWVVYIQDPKPECRRWSKSFRQRFRLPYHSFIDLLKMMHDDGNDLYFRRWKTSALVQLGEGQEDSACCRSSVAPRKVSPIELLLLGSLRYLGRGWTFDDLEESTFIS